MLKSNILKKKEVKIKDKGFHENKETTSPNFSPV